MTASFASQDWTVEFASRLSDSARVRTESMSWVFGPITLVVDADADHGLDATAITLDVHEGAVTGVACAPAGDAPRVPFEVGGSLARWKAVFGGTLDLVDAALDSRVRTTGDLPTLARHKGLLAAITAAGGEVETAWQDDEVAAATTA